MSTKNNPGAFRCYEAALPDEPIFTILGRDPAGPATLEFWAAERKRIGKTESPDDRDRIQDANRDALEMVLWRKDNLDPTGDGPTWKLPRSPDDGHPIREKDSVTYIPAERDGDEAVRLNVEWLKARTRDLTLGLISREFFAELITFACQSPNHSHLKFVVPQSDSPIRSPGDQRDYGDENPEDPPVAEKVAYTAQPPGMKNQTEGERVVIDTAPSDLSHAPEVPPHRFSVFHKGEQYAYARGLEISPMHLPTALDAMAKDGWHLVAIFGQTDSQHIGFIFERGIPGDMLFSAETPDDRFIIEYAERDSDGNCVRHRVPLADWPSWTEPCSDRGRGQMP